MMTSSSNIELLGAHNYLSWAKQELESIIQFGQPAYDIANNTKTIYKMPSHDDKLPSMDINVPSEHFRFEHNEKGDSLSSQGHQALTQAIILTNKLETKYQNDSTSLVGHLVSRISPITKTALSSAPNYTKAVNERNATALWKTIATSRSKCGSRVIRHRTQGFLNLKQGTDPFETFIDNIRTAETHITEDFGGQDSFKGWIKIDHLIAMVFMGGIDQEAFSFKIEGILATHPDCKIDDPWKTIGEFQDYSLQKQIVNGPTTEEPASTLASISNPTPAPNPTKKCTTCHSVFKPSKPFYKLCQRCLKETHTKPAAKESAKNLDVRSTKAARSIASTTGSDARITSGTPSDSRALKAARALIASADLDRARALVAASDLALIAAASDFGSEDEDSTYSSLVASFNPSDLSDPMSLSSLKSHCPKTTPNPLTNDPWYLDNAASYSTTNNPDMLESMSPVKPFSIGGIGSGVLATHTGFLKFLPRSIGKCYLTPTTSINLISLGYLNSQGADYHTEAANLVVEYQGRRLLSSPRMQHNLTPVPPAMLASKFFDRVTLNKSSLYPHSSNTNPYNSTTTLMSEVLCNECACTKPDTCSTTPTHSSTYASTSKHFTKEERSRAEEAETLHVFLHHPSDERLASGLSNGNFPSTHLTPADVYNNRTLRGPCPQCLQARMKQKSMAPSKSPPAAESGAQLSIDLSPVLPIPWWQHAEAHSRR